MSEASDGCTLLGVYGTYYSQAMEALDKLNEIRKEACEEFGISLNTKSSPNILLSFIKFLLLKYLLSLRYFSSILMFLSFCFEIYASV